MSTDDYDPRYWKPVVEKALDKVEAAAAALDRPGAAYATCSTAHEGGWGKEGTDS